MEVFRFVDIYATKGIEYLIVIGFLAAFVFFTRYLALRGGESGTGRRAAESVEWFRVPGEFHYHQGHGWVKAGGEGGGGGGGGGVPGGGGAASAERRGGGVAPINPPPAGSKLAQGEKGWVL